MSIVDETGENLMSDSERKQLPDKAQSQKFTSPINKPEVVTDVQPNISRLLTSGSGLPNSSTIDQIHYLHSVIGNQGVQRMLAQQNPVKTAMPTRHKVLHPNFTGKGYSVQREDEDADTSMSSAGYLTDENWVDVNKRGMVYKTSGANVRDKPTPEAEGSTVLQNLPQNTRVMILKHQPQPRWYAIRVMDGEHAGLSGYVADWLVRDDLPDPEATIYDVQGGDKLSELVQNHPLYAKYNITTGDDARSLVMAVYAANQNTGGVTMAGKADDGMWDSILDTADFSGYREQTRKVFQSIQLVAGKQIWLPSTSYVDAMKASGAIPSRPDWMNAGIEIGKAYGGFNAGIVDGLISSVVDLIVGLFELGKTIVDSVISICTGEALEAAGKLYDKFSSMTADELKQMAKGLLESVISGIASSVEDFLNKWNAPLIFDRWYFRGKVVGYIVAEIAMAFLSGGASAAKWLDKLGDVGRFFKNIVMKVDKALEKVPGMGGKKGDKTPNGAPRDRTPDSDKDGIDATERLRVIGRAKAIAEAHDTMDSPLPVVMAALNRLKLQHRWLNSFYPQPKAQPGHYQLIMRTTIDDDYTPGKSDEDTLREYLGDGPEAQGTTIHTPETMPKTSTIRARQGVASGGDDLPVASRDWLSGTPTPGNKTNFRMSLFPRQIADKMRGKQFANWGEFRQAFWKEVAADADLSTGFSKANKKLMQEGKAPFVINSERMGGGANAKYQLDHIMRIEHGGPVYDFDNLMIITPNAHSGLPGQVGDQVKHFVKE